MTRKVTRNYSLSVVAPFIAVGPRFGSTKLAAAAIRGALTLAVLSVLLLIAARPAQAQTETVLYNFCPGGGFCTDGGTPWSGLTSDGAGNFYGTTRWGGLGAGTVFELSPNGNGGWEETVLYSFTGGADGAQPFSPVIIDSAGNLYGTTVYGGANIAGIVFELSPVGASWTETVLYNFCSQSGCTDGGFAYTGVIMDPAGNLYGTTSGSINTPGTVFELSPSGDGWAEQTIYSAGFGSYAGLAMDAAGNIFGVNTTQVFELSPNGTGGWNPTVIHTFTGAPEDGSYAEGTPVFDQAGNLYGTTYDGGAQNKGTVYKLSPGENGKWTEEILYSFKGGKGGAYPIAGIVFDAAGNIYGTTENYNGTVFELAALGNSNYEHTVLWTFDGKDGGDPGKGLILDSAGNLYGTAARGGSHHSAGVVFEVSGVRAATVATLTSSPNPSTYAQAVTFTAVVTSSLGAPPDGETVTFMKGNKTVLGTGALSGGSASFTTSALPAGTNYVMAVYGGDLHFLGSTSNGVTQMVKKIATATTLTSSPNPSTYGQAVTFTAVVTSSLGAPPDGETVTFRRGTTVLGTGALSGGSASFTTSALPVGTNYIKAVYGGDTKLAKSTSNAVKQVVN